jgi:REP element-mobilizing transposase RayT
VRHITRTVGADIDCKLVERNGGSDHVQSLVTYPPTLAIAELLQRLKRSTG